MRRVYKSYSEVLKEMMENAMNDNLVKQVREALDGVSPGPWALDEGGEVHAGGSTVFAWPEWSDQSDPALHRNMEFGAVARDLMPAMADRIEVLTAELAAHRDTIAAAEARGRVAGLQEAAGIVVHPPLKVQRSFSEALRDQIMPAPAPITPAEAARVPEIAAFIEAVRVQANLLTGGACYERGKTIGRRLGAALRALAGDQP